MKHLRWLVVLLLAIAFVASLWAAGEVSKLTTFGYVGRSSDVSLIVDMDLARWKGKEGYIPLWIWLGHREKQTLYADRDTFSLVDPEGKTHRLADLNALRSNYGPNRIANDYSYLDRTKKVDNYGEMLYLNMTKIHDVAFFPNPSGKPHILYQEVELPPRTFFDALLYFPNPAGKNPGEYTFIYKDGKSGTEIEIPFRIPWSK